MTTLGTTLVLCVVVERMNLFAVMKKWMDKLYEEETGILKEKRSTIWNRGEEIVVLCENLRELKANFHNTTILNLNQILVEIECNGVLVRWN